MDLFRVLTNGTARAVQWVFLLLVFSLVPGCSYSPVDPDKAFVNAFPVPAGWDRVPTSEAPPVPGKRIDSWTDGQGGWLIAFRTLPDPRPTGVSSLAAEWAARHANQAGTQVMQHGEVRVGTLDLARIDIATNKETSEKVDTHRTYFGLPMSTGTFWLLWVYPGQRQQVVEKIISSFLRAWNPPSILSPR